MNKLLSQIPQKMKNILNRLLQFQLLRYADSKACLYDTNRSFDYSSGSIYCKEWDFSIKCCYAGIQQYNIPLGCYH